MIDLAQKAVVVVGFARTGQAVAEVAQARGGLVTVIEDRPDHYAAAATRLGVEVVVGPDRKMLAGLVGRADLVVVSPGVPPTHPVFALSDPTKLISEIELAFRPTTIPLVAVTGTNGKTTVTSLVATMLARSGVKVKAVGNIGEPLIAIVDDDLDLAVVEVSSFQLAYTASFRPQVATWLNFAEDHLDWHRNASEYADAKARIWSAQEDSDVAVANIDDAVVWAYAQKAPARLMSFGASRGDFHLDGTRFVGPQSEDYAGVTDLRRAYPHDVLNALAALSTAMLAGATPEGCRAGLRSFEPPAHRVAFVSSIDGVRYIDDSKATTPSAVTAALDSFSSVVLIAGGRNKGLDLSAIRRHVDESPSLLLRGVVAIGEAALEVAAAFEDHFSVERASSMEEAVRHVARLAVAGDVVLLSPGCASFDWYHSYEERGEDFTRWVNALDETAVR